MSPNRGWHVPVVGLSVPRPPGALTGSGVTVAVLDTGIDGTHPDLQGKIVAAYQIDAFGRPIAVTPNANHDQVGHGTRVAGVIASSRTDVGIAPGVRLVSIAFPSANEHYIRLLSVLAAVLRIPERIDIVNLSSGRPDSDFHPVQRQVLRSTLQRLLVRDILPVLSIGNQLAHTQSLPCCPGNFPEAVGVGATDNSGHVCATSPSGTFTLPDGSTSTKPDLVAPGEDIYTCESGGGYGFHSGTSMATPVVSGVAALFLEQRNTSVADLRQRIFAGCLLLPEPLERQGHGLVQVPSSGSSPAP